jgi:hypothetical protein
VPRSLALVVAAAVLATACAEPAPLTGPVAGAPQLAKIADADQGGRRLTATLTGAAEVPGPGDVDGIGTAVITVNVGQGQLCYELAVRNIAPATMAHVHVGAATAAGPVVRGLTPPTSGSSAGCAPITRELARAIVADPANYYVNVHNAPFPAGAIRGQLSK